jgi:hypothetical protein
MPVTSCALVAAALLHPGDMPNHRMQVIFQHLYSAPFVRSKDAVALRSLQSCQLAPHQDKDLVMHDTAAMKFDHRYTTAGYCSHAGRV